MILLSFSFAFFGCFEIILFLGFPKVFFFFFFFFRWGELCEFLGTKIGPSCPRLRRRDRGE